MSELQDLAALIRAGTPLIVVETPDEPRVVDMFRQTLTRVWRAMYRWSITEGLRRIDLDGEDPAELSADVGTTLRAIRGADQRGVYLLLDFHPYLDYAGSQRQLRDIVQRRDCLPHTVVLVGHRVELPPGLESKAVRYRPKLPDAAALRRMVGEQAEPPSRRFMPVSGMRPSTASAPTSNSVMPGTFRRGAAPSTAS